MTNSQNADTPTTHRLSHFPERGKRHPRFPFPNHPGNVGKRPIDFATKQRLTCKNDVSQDHRKRTATGQPGTFPVSPPSLEGKRERSPRHCDLVKHAQTGIMNAMAGRNPDGTLRSRNVLDPDGTLPTVCKATNREGNPCGRSPVIGAAVCYTHGGAAGITKLKAAERVADLSAQRALDATLARMNLDAPPIADPAAAMASLAGRLLSGFEGVQSRLNECREQGRVPNDVDIAERALWVKELRSLLTDMTRLQVGVQLASRYMPDGKAQDGAESAEQGDPVLADLPDVSSIVSAVLETEHRLETDRLVKVEAAKAQGQLPAGLTIVGETEQAS